MAKLIALNSYLSRNLRNFFAQSFGHEADDGEDDESWEDGCAGGDAGDEVSVAQNVSAKRFKRRQSEHASPTAWQRKRHLEGESHS